MTYKEVGIGCWVFGHDVDGHLVQGYVEQIYPANRAVRVRVVHACCPKLLGEQRYAQVKYINVLDTSNNMDVEGYIRNMIDFALDTGNREWFMELTEELRKLTNPEPVASTIYIAFRVE